MRCCWRTSALTGSSLLSVKEARLSLAFLGCFAPFRGTTSLSSTSCTFLFFFKSRQGNSSIKVTGRGQGGGRLTGTWDLGTSLDNPSLFLIVRRPFSHFLELMFISASSSELGSTWAIMSLGEWAVDYLSNSSSESGSWIIGFALSSLSSSK